MVSPTQGLVWPNTAPGVFPELMVFEPELDHRQTFIMLRGRGSLAAKYAPSLLAIVSTDGHTIQSAFAHAKIIFVTAARNRATIYRRSLTHQWFDSWHLTDYTKRQDLQRDGLKKSCTYLHKILNDEIAVIGSKNVVLWGLSQGCATSLTSLLTWDGESFAATVGMCGYLPFCYSIEEIAARDHSDFDNDEPIEGSGDEELNQKNGIKPGMSFICASRKDFGREAIEFLTAEIEMEEKTGMVFRDMPVYLRDGTEDAKVSISVGRQGKKCLDMVGATVEMVEYPGSGHWYSDEILTSIFRFLRSTLD